MTKQEEYNSLFPALDPGAAIDFQYDCEVTMWGSMPAAVTLVYDGTIEEATPAFWQWFIDQKNGQ